MGQLKASNPGSSDKVVAIKTLKGKRSTPPDLHLLLWYYCELSFLALWSKDTLNRRR